jgi:hypothetical protein
VVFAAPDQPTQVFEYQSSSYGLVGTLVGVDENEDQPVPEDPSADEQ